MNNNVYILEDRAILYINGPDTKDFLQNLISNDINKVSENSSCFASLFTPQGKFLYEFIVVKHKSGYFIDCEKSQSGEIFKQLNLYKIRTKVEILDLSNEFVVASFGYEKYLSIADSKDILGFTFKYREDPILLDPRNKNLGARLIINLEKLYLSLKKLKLKSLSSEEYYKLSFELGIPQKNTNKLKEKIFGIECNFEELNALDFKKGCYVGQENTARIKLKKKLSKRLLPIKITQGKIKENDSIFFKEVEIGKVLIDKDYPFAVIKVANLKVNDFINKNLTCNSANIKINIPNWMKLE